MRVKRLQLERWMTERDEELFAETISMGGYEKVEPLFLRPGRYKIGDTVWFELPDGTAYLCPDSRSFDYNLQLLDGGRLSQSELAALEAVNRVGLASEDQKRLLALEHDYRKRKRLRRDVWRRLAQLSSEDGSKQPKDQ